MRCNMQNATLAKLWTIIYATHGSQTLLSPSHSVSISLSLWLSPSRLLSPSGVSIALCCST